MRAVSLVAVACFAVVTAWGDPPPRTLEAARDDAVREAWQAERLHDQFRYADAAAAYATAATSLAGAFGEAHPRTLIALNNHASALLEMNRAAEAEAVLRDALNRRERASPAEDETLAATWSNLGEALLATNRITAAIAMHERALALRQRLLPPGHPDIAASLTRLGEALRQNGELTRARGLFEQAALLWAAPAGKLKSAAAMPLMPGYALTLNSLSMLHDAEGRHGDAGRALLDALAAASRAYGPRHPFTATLHMNLAGHFSERRDWKRAEQHCRDALSVFELEPSHQDSRFAAVLTMHARILDQLSGRKREARAQRKRAAEILALH